MQRKHVFFLGFIGGLGICSTDIYVPSLPKLSEFYDVSTYHMNLTMSIYFIMTGIGTLAFLRLSKTLSNSFLNLIFLCLFSLGGFLISSFDSYKFILIGRALQGIGFGVIQTNIVSFIRKQDNLRFAKNMATFSLAAESLCLFTPILGVFLYDKIAWWAPFTYIGILGILMIFHSQRIFTAHKKETTSQDSNLVIPSTKSFTILRKDKTFWIFNGISSLISGTGWALIAISPYILQNNGFSDFFHGIFYFAYTIHYMLGNFIIERISHEGRLRLENIAMKGIAVCSTIFLFAALLKIVTLFIIGMMLLALITGMFYGIVFESAQKNLGKDNQRLLNSATTIMLLCRLCTSSSCTAIVSWLFTQDPKFSLLFGTITTLLVSILLHIGYNSREKKSVEI